MKDILLFVVSLYLVNCKVIGRYEITSTADQEYPQENFSLSTESAEGELYFLYNKETKKCLNEYLRSSGDCAPSDNIFRIDTTSYNDCIEKGDVGHCKFVIFKENRGELLGIDHIQGVKGRHEVIWKQASKEDEQKNTFHIGDEMNPARFEVAETSLSDLWSHWQGAKCHRIGKNEWDLPYILAENETASACNEPTFADNFVFVKSVDSLYPVEKCSVIEQGALYDSDCNCVYSVGMDDTKAVSARMDVEEEIRFFPSADTGKAAETRISSLYIENISVSGEFVAGGDPWYGFEEKGFYQGAVNIFKKVSGEWKQVGKVEPQNIDANAEFGWDVSLFGDMLAVGAPAQNKKGSVYLYKYQLETASWEQIANITGDEKNAGFGRKVILQGNLLAVGDDWYENNEGAIFLYKLNSVSGKWDLQDTVTNKNCGERFGYSMALTEDAGLLAGCFAANDSTGAVYYYKKSSDGKYSFQQEMKASDSTFGMEFGQTIEVDKNIAIIAAPMDLPKVYMFKKFDERWKEVGQIDAPKNTDSYYFGLEMGISEKNVLISSFYNTYSYKLSCPKT